MKKNMGTADRIVRVMIALVIAALYFANVISGTVAIVLLAVSAAFIVTSFIAVCPLYYPFGLQTKQKSKKHHA